MFVEASGWGVVRVTGADRVRFLQGMCMGNVATLPSGAWLRTASLNPKGRLMSIYDLLAREEDLLLLTQPGLAEATRQLLDRHAIADDVSFELIEQPVHRVWDTALAVWTAPPVLAPPPGPAASREAWEVRRIEAGLPLYGVDVDEACFPFETPLVRLIDHGKGCYVGQEPVARVHARGTPSRTLRGLRILSGEGPLAPGARIRHPAREDAGQVTSSAVSPAHGPIALGFLHRQVWDPGGQVEVEGRAAEVVELPFR
jgi:tRNA-modifying protein YgfZ